MLNRSDDRRPFLPFERIALAKVHGNVLEGRPAYALMPVDIFDQTLQHQNDLRATTDIRMNREAERGVVHLAIDPVELIAPKRFDVARIHKAVAVRRLLDEHHWRQVIDIPIRTDFDDIDLLAVLKRLHPLLRLLGVVDHGPLVADPGVEGLEVPIALAVIIFEAVFLQKRCRRGRHFPPRRHIAARAHAAQLFDDLDGFGKYGLFLGGRHRHRILMRIAMRADLMSLVHDLAALFREGFDGMARYEESRLETVFLEKPEQPGNADLAGEYAALDIGWRIASSIGPDPARNGVDVRSESTDDFSFCHYNSPYLLRLNRMRRNIRRVEGAVAPPAFVSPLKATRLQTTARSISSFLAHNPIEEICIPGRPRDMLLPIMLQGTGIGFTLLGSSQSFAVSQVPQLMPARLSALCTSGKG